MNFLFRDTPPHAKVKQESPKTYDFTDEQLHILGEMRILKIIRPSIEGANLATHDARYEQLFEKLKNPNIQDDEAVDEVNKQYDFFVENYNKFSEKNKNTLH